MKLLALNTRCTNIKIQVLDRRIGDEVGYWGFKVYKEEQWNGGNYWRNIGYGGDKHYGKRPLYHHVSLIYTVNHYSTSVGDKSLGLKHNIDSTKGHPVSCVYVDTRCIICFPLRYCLHRWYVPSSCSNQIGWPCVWILQKWKEWIYALRCWSKCRRQVSLRRS